MTRRIVIGSLIGVLLCVNLIAIPLRVQIATAQTEEPTSRQITITVSYTEYEWWLIQWADNQILCRIIVDHAGLPTPDEVLKACGQVYYEVWINETNEFHLLNLYYNETLWNSSNG